MVSPIQMVFYRNRDTTEGPEEAINCEAPRFYFIKRFGGGPPFMEIEIARTAI
jgi:hypothetical protein